MPRHHSCTYSCLFVPSCLTRLLPCNLIRSSASGQLQSRYAFPSTSLSALKLRPSPASLLTSASYLVVSAWLGHPPAPAPAAELYVCFPAHWPPLPPLLTALRSSYRPATIQLLPLYSPCCLEDWPQKRILKANLADLDGQLA